jgi:hypothetical protein
VAFKLPVLLPAKVGFAAAETDDGWRFDLFGVKNGKPHLTGSISSPR